MSFECGRVLVFFGIYILMCCLLYRLHFGVSRALFVLEFDHDSDLGGCVGSCAACSQQRERTVDS